MSDTGINVIPNIPKCPVPVRKPVPAPAVSVLISYELTEVGSTGIIDVFPHLEKFPVRVLMPARIYQRVQYR